MNKTLHCISVWNSCATRLVLHKCFLHYIKCKTTWYIKSAEKIPKFIEYIVSIHSLLKYFKYCNAVSTQTINSLFNVVLICKKIYSNNSTFERKLFFVLFLFSQIFHSSLLMSAITLKRKVFTTISCDVT